MAYFELVRENVQTDNFDLIKFLRSSPLTPESDNLIVKMKEFNLDVLRNCIIYNIYCQGLTIKTETSRRLIVFLEADFDEISKKIYLQVLLHYTKMDIIVLYDSYSITFETNSTAKHTKLSPDQYFDVLINAFVMKADSANTILKISKENSDLVRKALVTRPVLLALEVCLNDILTSDNKFNEWLINEISNMKIYFVDKFPPIEGLRGACLIDGILLCVGELDERTEVHKADLITLAVHECAHYLASDFNCSNPFKYLSELGENRSDLFIAKKHSEIGRTAEMLLFDGIQPRWSLSSEKAARQFLSGLFSGLKYPVIPKDQQEDLGLIARMSSTLAFGIDVNEHEQFCC